MNGVSQIVLRARRVIHWVIDQPRRCLKNIVREPFKYIVFGILLILGGVAEIPFSFAEDAVSILKDINFEILVLLLLGIYILYQRHGDLLHDRRYAVPQVVDTRATRTLIRFLPYLLLSLIGLFAFLLRMYNIDRLDSYTDESAHLMGALNYRLGLPVSYDRFPVLSYLIYLVWQLAAPSSYLDFLYWSRMPGALVGALTVFPLYALARRVSVPVALTSCILWAISPWAIGVSRYVREYTYFPFFILLTLISFFAVVDIVRKGARDDLKRLVLHASVLALFFIYTLLIDRSSTIKVGAIVIAGAALGIFAEAIVKGMSSDEARRERALSYGLILTVAGVILVLKNFSISAFGYQLDDKYLAVFMSSDTFEPTMWWSGYGITKSIMSVIIFVGCAVAAIRKNFSFFHFFFIFIIMLFFYYLFFDRYFKPRYCYYTLPVFCIVIAAGVWHLIELAAVFRHRFAKAAAFLVVVLFLSSVFKPENTYMALNPTLKNPVENTKTRDSGYFRVTGEYHQGMRRVGRFLKTRIEEEDVFITTIYQPLLTLGLRVHPKRIFYYKFRSRDVEKQVRQIMHKHKQGWMILDFRRNGKLTKRRFSDELRKPFRVGPYTMRLVYDKHEAQVFRWKRK